MCVLVSARQHNVVLTSKKKCCLLNCLKQISWSYYQCPAWHVSTVPVFLNKHQLCTLLFIFLMSFPFYLVTDPPHGPPPTVHARDKCTINCSRVHARPRHCHAALPSSRLTVIFAAHRIATTSFKSRHAPPRTPSVRPSLIHSPDAVTQPRAVSTTARVATQSLTPPHPIAITRLRSPIPSHPPHPHINASPPRPLLLLRPCAKHPSPDRAVFPTRLPCLAAPIPDAPCCCRSCCSCSHSLRSRPSPRPRVAAAASAAGLVAAAWAVFPVANAVAWSLSVLVVVHNAVCVACGAVCAVSSSSVVHALCGSVCRESRDATPRASVGGVRPVVSARGVAVHSRDVVVLLGVGGHVVHQVPHVQTSLRIMANPRRCLSRLPPPRRLSSRRRSCRRLRRCSRRPSSRRRR